MRIKDQEKIMEAVGQYLLAKDRYLHGSPEKLQAAYLEADRKLRDTYQQVFESWQK